MAKPAIPFSAFVRTGDTGANEAFTRLGTYAAANDGVTIIVDGDYTLTAQRAFTSIDGLHFIGNGSITLDSSGLTSVDYVWRITGQNVSFDGPTIKVEGEDMAESSACLDLQITHGLRGFFHLVDISAAFPSVRYYMAAVRPSSGTAKDRGSITGVQLQGGLIEDQRSGGMAFRGLLNADIGDWSIITPNQETGSTREEFGVAVLASDRVRAGHLNFDEGSGLMRGSAFAFGPGGLASVSDLEEDGRMATLDNGPLGDSNLIADAGTSATITDTYSAGPASSAGWTASDFTLFVTGDFETGDLVLDSVDLSTKTVTISKADDTNFANESFYWYAINNELFNEFLTIESITGEGGTSGAPLFIWGWRKIHLKSVSGSSNADYVAGLEWCEDARVDFGFAEDGPTNNISFGLYHYINNVQINGGIFKDNARIWSRQGAAPFLNVTFNNQVFKGSGAAFIRYVANDCENWMFNIVFNNPTMIDGGYVSFESRLTASPGINPGNIRVNGGVAFNATDSPIQFYGVDGLKVRRFELVSGTAAAVKNRNDGSRPDSANVSLQVEVPSGGTVLTEVGGTQLGDVSVPALPEV